MTNKILYEYCLLLQSIFIKVSSSVYVSFILNLANPVAVEIVKNNYFTINKQISVLFVYFCKHPSRSIMLSFFINNFVKNYIKLN